MSVRENGKVICDDRYGGPCELGKPCTHRCVKTHRFSRERRRWNKKHKEENVAQYYNEKDNIW